MLMQLLAKYTNNIHLSYTIPALYFIRQIALSQYYTIIFSEVTKLNSWGFLVTVEGENGGQSVLETEDICLFPELVECGQCKLHC